MKKEAVSAVRATTAETNGLGHIVQKLISPTKNKSEGKEIFDNKMIEEVVKTSNNTILLANTKKVKVIFTNILQKSNDPQALLEMMMKNES